MRRSGPRVEDCGLLCDTQKVVRPPTILRSLLSKGHNSWSSRQLGLF